LVLRPANRQTVLVPFKASQDVGGAHMARSP
jgi:hypothetical protein